MSGRAQPARRAALVAALVVLADQVSKGVLRAGLAPGERRDLFAGIDLVRVGNDGIAFGLFDGTGTAVVIVVAVAFTLLLAYFLLSSDQDGLWLPIGLLAGGALGNLIDRVREGAVTDFIDLGPWPAFNLADVAITAGVILLAALFLRPEAGHDATDRPAGG